MSEIFALAFFRNALLMCVLLAGLFGLLSFFIVMRKMAFLGAGVAHTAFGGVALGVLLGIHPFYTSLVFCVVSAVLIGSIARHGQISYDSAIGIFFSFAMALGAIFISLKKAYTFDLSGYLFGNILGVNNSDIFVTVTLILLFLLFWRLYFQQLLFMTFEERVARVSGINTGFLDTLMLVFLALIIVVSIKVVGIILVSALVVLPASFARLWTNRYRLVIMISIIYTLVIMTGGLFLSYGLDTPTGATMVILGGIIYFTSMIIRNINKR